MWKETLRALETGALAEIAVVAFFVAFVLVVAYALTMSKRTREQIKNQPLHDALEVFPDRPAPPASPADAADAADPADHA
jgi:cbb3-type cytochrome oxidase subunit 3